MMALSAPPQPPRASTLIARAQAAARAAFRRFALALVRLYHPEIARAGPPLPTGPCVVVANHPSGLIDPLVLQLALGRPLAFLGKQTLFHNPVSRFALAAFDAIPVARRQDARSADDEEAAAARNVATFDACRVLLARGVDVALFPEGVSHDHPGLLPLRTGAARIALSSLHGAQAPASLSVCPVGLLYRSKHTFRSQVSALCGEPIDVAAFVVAHGTGPDAVRLLTTHIAASLQRVVLEAESTAMRDGLRMVAALTSPGADVGVVHQRALALAEAFAALQQRDPAHALRLLSQAQELLAMADELGLLASEDERAALALERPAPGPLGFVWAIGSLLLQAGPAAVGVALNWPMWRLVGWLATVLARGEADVVATHKLIGGMVIFPLGWLAIGAACLGFGAGPGLAMGASVAAALLAPLALRFSERLEVRRRALRAGWLRLMRADAAFALAARRRELAAAVQEVLAPATVAALDGPRAQARGAAPAPHEPR